MRWPTRRKSKIRLRKRPILIVGGAVFVGVCLLAAFYIGALYQTVIHRFEGDRWSLPSKIYSDSFILYPGQDIEDLHLLERITRLGYRLVSGRPRHSGEYNLTPERIEIFLHDFKYSEKDFIGQLVEIKLEQKRIQSIRAPMKKQELALVELEPELIAGFYNETWEERDLVQLEEVPPHLISAILAVEDSRFYHHIGIDPRSVLRAFWVNLKHVSIVQGGSTLTQQLVKNFYLDHRRTLTRKFNEAIMALLLEVRYTKDAILEAYLNEIYMGQSGSMGIYGMGEAARFYFGKKPEVLTLAESALLAGIINSPNVFSPFNNPPKAQDRRTHVLDRMRRLEMISENQYQKALDEKISIQPPIKRRREAAYFVDLVRQQLSEGYSPEVLASEGLRIFTTLDLQLQHQAEEALLRGLEGLEARFPALIRTDPSDRLQGCLIVLQPQTGYLKAVVGGRDYSVSQFNRATQAHRQPGSLFKLFVYAAAITREPKSDRSPYTTATLIDDSPLTLVSGETNWTPENYDKNYYGPVTLRTALERSLNVATAKLAQEVGIDRVAEIAYAMGIISPLNRVPSLALGTSEVTPLEMVVAYGTVANSGVRVEPLAIKAVVDTSRVLERRSSEMKEVFTPQNAYLLTHLLEGVVERGTARGLRDFGFDRPVAGKTGTSSDYRDAWFAGYTPDLLTLVWVGFDQNDRERLGQDIKGVSLKKKTVPLTGAGAAMPIWADFMKQAVKGLPATDFIVPSGIIFEDIDPETGLITGIGCPGGIHEAFIEGTQPNQGCGPSDKTKKGIWTWLKGLF